MRYRFGPRERGGALAGWRAGQILTVAVGLAVSVVVLQARPDALGAAVAVIILVVCGLLATWPISGRTGDQWLPVVVRWGSRRAAPGGLRRMDALGGLRLLGVGSRQMGVVHDHRERTLTAALSVRGRVCAARSRRAGAEGDGLVLGSGHPCPRRLADPPRAVAGGDTSGSGPRCAQLPLVARCGRSGLGVRGVVRGAAERHGRPRGTHDVVLAVQVRVPKSVEVGAAALEREMATLARVLVDADVVVDGMLSDDDLAARLMCTYEPQGVPPAGGATTGDPWPMAMSEEWSHVRVDGLMHATFWIAEWPRTEVRSDFLAPLLLGSARTTLSVVMEPLGPEKAARKVEASRTADIAEAELRRRNGFIFTARQLTPIGGTLAQPRSRAGRRARLLPLLRLRHGLGAHRGRARDGVRGGAAHGRARRGWSFGDCTATRHAFLHVHPAVGAWPGKKVIGRSATDHARPFPCMFGTSCGRGSPPTRSPRATSVRRTRSSPKPAWASVGW